MTIMDVVTDLTIVASRLPEDSREFKSCTITGAVMLLLAREYPETPPALALTSMLAVVGSS